MMSILAQSREELLTVPSDGRTHHRLGSVSLSSLNYPKIYMRMRNGFIDLVQTHECNMHSLRRPPLSHFDILPAAHPQYLRC